MTRHSDDIDKGLYLENLNTIVPWQTDLDEIMKYGQPEILVLSDQRTDAVWKNVEILGGLTVDLTAMFWRTLGNNFDNVQAYIDESEFEKFKPHMDRYFEQEAVLKKDNELEHHFIWTTNNCTVRLGQGDRFGTYYYLDIKRKKNWL